MANEFRVKNGLIVDGVTDSGVNPVTISDAVISSASALELRSTADANPAILIHSNGGDDETIKIHSNQGTGTDSIILLSDEGGIDVDAALAITIDAVGIALGAGSGELDLTTTGTLDINSAALDIDASGAVTIDAAGTASHIALTTAHTTGVAFHIDANAAADSEVQIDAGILDIDVTGAATIDTGGALTLTSAADFTIDSNTDIILDANGADITFKDDGTATHHFFNGSSISEIAFGYNARIKPTASAHGAGGRTLTIQGGDTTAGTSDDQPGGNLKLRGGDGKGSGNGGGVTLVTGVAGSSGSSLNTGDDMFLTLGGNGTITINDGDTSTLIQSDTVTIAPRSGAGNQAHNVVLTLGDASNSNHNADRAIHWGTSEFVYRHAMNAVGTSTVSIMELGNGSTTAAHTSNNLPSQAQYATAKTAFAYGDDGEVYRIGHDNATNGQVLTFVSSTDYDGKWMASDVSGTGDVSASSNFGTNHVLIRSEGTSKGVESTGISVDNSDNVTGMGTLGVGAITTTGNFITGVDDTGVDVRFFSATASEGVLYDASEDELALLLTTKLKFHDVGGGEEIFASADGHLEINAGTTLDMTSGTIDINASTAVTIDTPSITITDSTTSSATEGGFIRLVSNDGAAMADDHRLGVIEFAGAEDASNTITVGARIEAICDAGWSATENGAALVMYTTDANASQSEVLRLDSDKLATFAGDVTILGDFNITGDINSTSVTDLDVTDKTITIANGAGDSAAADGAGIVVGGAAASLLYDHTGTQWEFNKNVEFAGHILPNADDTYDIGSASLAWQDLFLEGDITLTDAGTLSTSAGALTITAAAASTWSTSSGALTLTSAAACTWSAAAGDLTLDSAAGTANLDGHTGVQITSSNSGNIDLDSVADIVLDVADNKHVFFQEGGVTHSAIAHGTVEIADLAGTANATAIDVFDCTVFQAVKYFILVEDRVADHYMTTEILVLGDDNGASAATAVMTTYAVLFNEAELGVFTVAGSGNNITLSYNPTDQTGSDQHRVRVVANRIASLSDSGQ